MADVEPSVRMFSGGVVTDLGKKKYEWLRRILRKPIRSMLGDGIDVTDIERMIGAVGEVEVLMHKLMYGLKRSERQRKTKSERKSERRK